jgi:hypothetical protein
MLTTNSFRTELCIWGARGGHGATTVAGALGVFLQTLLASHEADAFAWMWGGDRLVDEANDSPIADSGVLSGSLDPRDTNIVVLRGPCTLGIVSLAPLATSIDHLIVIREPWRPVRREDVEASLGMKIDAEVPHSPRVARLADAGLLPGRVSDLSEFAELKAWALSLWPTPSSTSRANFNDQQPYDRKRGF